MWCLARNLPLMIGSKIPESNPYWENFLLLLTIIDYVFAPAISADIVDYLRQLIYEHHKAFRELYPDCSFTPKLHYVIHIPEWIKKWVMICGWAFQCNTCNGCIMHKFNILHNPYPTVHRCGPVSRLWCMRFEAKHSYFKTLAHRVKCFKNITKTLACRHQRLMCFTLSNSTCSPIVKEMKTGKGIYWMVFVYWQWI